MEDTLTDIGYLLSVRKVAGVTLQNYLTGLRMAHLTRGHFSPWIRPDIIKLLITGVQIRDQVRKRMEGKKGRLAVTPAMLSGLREGLKTSRMVVT